jgi:hypothetical protein
VCQRHSNAWFSEDSCVIWPSMRELLAGLINELFVEFSPVPSYAAHISVYWVSG